MSNLNLVQLIGRLGNDPDVRATTSGSRVANISLATSETWKDKTTGEKKESTEWHRVTFFNRQAEIVEQYLSKGSLIYVSGNLRTRKWQDKDGQDRYTTEITAREMQMLGGKPSGGSTPAASGQGQQAAPAQSAGPAIDFVDEIPFIYSNYGMY